MVDNENKGIVRRVDELGRIVLPREMRKMLNVREGSKLEIGIIEGDKFLLTKYSPMNSLGDYAVNVVKAISSVLEHDVVLCDLEKVVSANKKKYIDRKLTTNLLECIYKRDIVFKRKSDDSILLDIFEDLKQDYCCELIVPIIKDSDVLGALLVLGVEEKCFDTDAVKVCKAFVNYLVEIMP